MNARRVLPRSVQTVPPRHDALDVLVRRYRDRLVRHATGIVHDPDHAADLVQEAFVRALREPRLLDADFRAGAWLYRVTTNLALNSVRDRRRREEIVADMPGPRSASPDQADAVLDAERAELVQRALADLSPPHREILQARFFGDRSYQEIADVLGLKLGTVMSRLSRAKDALEVVLAARPVADV